MTGIYFFKTGLCVILNEILYFQELQLLEGEVLPEGTRVSVEIIDPKNTSIENSFNIYNKNFRRSILQRKIDKF